MKLPFVVKWDWLLSIASKINGFQVAGIEFIPFIVVVNDLNNKSLIRHETIHFYQMMETLIIGYYLLYAFYYIKNRIFGLSHDKAYRNINFEIEAYNNQDNENYLKVRKYFAWWGINNE
jgi:hypothetical protein